MNMGFRANIVRLTQAVLALDGVLHLLEVISAYREQAWVTFGLTSFHTLIFFAGVYLVGHDHSHHAETKPELMDSVNR